MNGYWGRIARKAALGALIALSLYGCTAERLHREGMNLLEEGKYEEGVAKLAKATQADPSNPQIRAHYLTQRETVANRLLKAADAERTAGRPDAAEQLYQRVLTVDPSSERAAAGIGEARRDRRHAKLLEEAHELWQKQDTEGAQARLQLIHSENPANPGMLALKRQIGERQSEDNLQTPTLHSMYRKPVSLDFYNASLKMVFDVLSRTSGINFIFDKEVRPDLTASISVKNTYLENVVDLLLTTNQLEKKILNANTVLIYPNVPNKVKEYQDLMVKTFYIQNADVKQTAAMVKTLLKTRDIYVDEKLNMMVMRDAPDTIRLAEKLIAVQDLAEPEVMLEVEVLEVTRGDLLSLGIQYPDQLTLSPLAPAGGGALTLQSLRTLNSNRIGATVGNVSINAKSTESNINLLANPRIRTRNREKAKIMIGDRVPVITTTSSSTGFVSDSVQYLDVGLKLEVEPNIYLQNDVAIRVALEVSSIANQITGKNGTLTYQIGTRSASTVLRLKDGETQVLAGLISDNERASASKVPGLGQFPVLGRLFSTHQNDHQKTEIVLSITPHLVRNLNRPGAGASEFWSGSETTLRSGPLTLPRAGKAAAGAPAVKPAAGEALPAAPSDAGKADIPVPVKDEAASEANAAQPPTMVALSWQGPKQIKAGEQFRMALNLKSDGGLRSLPFQIAYDTALLKVVEISEGEFFKQNGGQTSFASNVDVASGRIFVGATRAGSEAAAGSSSLAFVTFKALSGQPKAEIRLLTATPVGLGDKIPNPDMPDPHVINIQP